jgi:hypothetical protein
MIRQDQSGEVETRKKRLSYFVLIQGSSILKQMLDGHKGLIQLAKI